MKGTSSPRASAWAALYLRVSGHLVEAVSIAVLVAMVAMNAANILFRVLFHGDLEWTQELLLASAMALYFYSVALITKANADIRIDAVLRVLPRRAQRVFGLMARLATLAFQCTVLWLAIETIQFVQVFRTPILEFSEAWYFVPVIIGAADMAITEAIYLLRQWHGGAGAPGTGLVD